MALLLVVEDEQDIRELIVRRLREDGHETMLASTAQGALAQVDEHGMPDAAILDVDLPGIDGIELLYDLRARRPGLPAIFLTVLWSAGIIARMRAAGGLYVPKPFTAQVLRGALHEVLDGAQSGATGGSG